MRARGPRTAPAELALFAALAAWGLFPVALLLVRASVLHARFTGADGLIGADGVLGADQLQYLAWIRDASAHGLVSDLFTLAPSANVYLQPLFAISGALVRAGMSVQLAYLVWKPLAILAMCGAALAWARRTIGDGAARRAAVIALMLFLYTPLAALVEWTHAGSGPFRFSLFLLGDELLAATKLWGYVPSAFALALVVTAVLCVERAIGQPAPGRPAGGRPARARLLTLAAAAALLASWMHPWQGITMIIVFAGLAVLRPAGDRLATALPAVAAAIPLGYYWLLSHSDPAWRLASHYEVIPRLPALVLLAGLGPPALIAALGVRRPGGVMIEQAILLWIGGCLVTYFVNDAFAPHALQGLSVPLSVLLVRGWTRLRLPAVLGVLAVALVTIPGLAYDARKFVTTADGSLVQYYLPGGDQRALAWIADRAPPGGVLAPTPFAAVIPSQTGRAVWVGHGYWSRDYPRRARRADALFGRRERGRRARAFVASTGATLLIADCRHHAPLARELAPMLASVHRFGCATVYVLAADGARSARR
jgi:hypothetical protein